MLGFDGIDGRSRAGAGAPPRRVVDGRGGGAHWAPAAGRMGLAKQVGRVQGYAGARTQRFWSVSWAVQPRRQNSYRRARARRAAHRCLFLFGLLALSQRALATFGDIVKTMFPGPRQPSPLGSACDA